jgi:predicted Mrr-cat superfamily restriction endonuclease
MQLGDLVVMFRKFQRTIAIGRVVGDRVYRADAPAGFCHVRAAERLPDWN